MINGLNTNAIFLKICRVDGLTLHLYIFFCRDERIAHPY